MSHISDAHSEWHLVHGKYAVCPLDCGAQSPEAWEDEARANAEWEAKQEAEAKAQAAHEDFYYRQAQADYDNSYYYDQH